MSRCKPGDLAIVIGGCYPENFGAIVQVIGAYAQRSGAWVVESRGRLLHGYCKRQECEMWSRMAAAGDKILRPIRGLTPDEIDRLQLESLERA